jgi:hypothetical protein
MRKTSLVISLGLVIGAASVGRAASPSSEYEHPARNAATARIVAPKTITVNADPTCQARIDFDAVSGDGDLWNSSRPHQLTARQDGWYVVSYNYSISGSSFVQGNVRLVDSAGQPIDTVASHGGFYAIAASIFGHTNGSEVVHLRRGDSVQGVVCISGGPGGMATLTRGRLSLMLR